MPATVSNGSRSIVNKKHNYLRVPAYSGWSECSMVPGGTNHLLHLPLWYSWILSLEKGPSLNLFSCIPCCRLICLASLLRLKLSMKWTECLVGGGGWRWLGWEGADLSPQISAVLFVVPLCYNWYEPSALRKGLFRMVNNCCRVVGSPWFPVGSPPPLPAPCNLQLKRWLTSTKNPAKGLSPNLPDFLPLCLSFLHGHWSDGWPRLEDFEKAFLLIVTSFCSGGYASLICYSNDEWLLMKVFKKKRLFSKFSQSSTVLFLVVCGDFLYILYSYCDWKDD